MVVNNSNIDPEVYLRRRFAALGAAVIAVILVILLAIFLLTRGGSDDNDQLSAPVVTSSAPAVTTPPPVPPSGANIPAVDPNQISDYCANNQIAVLVSANKGQYAPQEQPEFTIAVTNVGLQPCARDLGTGIQKVSVFTTEQPPRQVWSNTDCSLVPGVDVKQLTPGQQSVFKIFWSRNDSVPGCAAKRNEVAPGSYTVVAQIGDKASEPVPFTLK